MKAALVTGAFGNLGRAVVQQFLSDGYAVTGTLAPNEKSEPINHSNFESHTVDLTDPSATSAFLDQLLSKKNIDAAVLTVGGFAMGTVAESTLPDIQKMIRLNFDTAFNTAQPLFRHMLERGEGRIFLIGARPALQARDSKGMFAYGLSKAMLVRLAEMINIEAKGTNVTATVIVPSTIDTPQNRASMPDADPSKWVKAEDIANVIAFYCSEKGSSIREPLVKVFGGS